MRKIHDANGFFHGFNFENSKKKKENEKRYYLSITLNPVIIKFKWILIPNSFNEKLFSFVSLHSLEYLFSLIFIISGILYLNNGAYEEVANFEHDRTYERVIKLHQLRKD